MESGISEKRIVNGNLASELARLLSPDQVITVGPEMRVALQDGTGSRGITGEAEALVLPADAVATQAYAVHNGVGITISKIHATAEK